MFYLTFKNINSIVELQFFKDSSWRLKVDVRKFNNLVICFPIFTVTICEPKRFVEFLKNQFISSLSFLTYTYELRKRLAMKGFVILPRIVDCDLGNQGMVLNSLNYFDSPHFCWPMEIIWCWNEDSANLIEPVH